MPAEGWRAPSEQAKEGGDRKIAALSFGGRADYLSYKMNAEDRALLDAFATRVRLVVPSAAVWAFGSRARGSPHPDSDLDLCVVVGEVTREVREVIYGAAWEIGFEHGRLLAPVILTAEDFERGPMSASTLVANIRRDGVAA